MDEEMKFIDTHHHLWDLDKLEYAWLSEEDPEETEVLGDYSSIRKSYSVTDLIKDFRGSNVEKSIHLQANYSGPDNVEETKWLSELSESYGFPHAIIAFTDLMSDKAEEELDKHCEYSKMRGVRTFYTGEQLLEPKLNKGLQALQSRNLIYDLHALKEDMEYALTMANNNPNLQVILGHAGLPLERSKEYFDEWSKSLKLLAKADNVAIKISGLGMADHNWDSNSIKEWVLACIEIFGVDRCMFGSNWPVDSLYSSYKELIDSYKEVTEGFNANEKINLFSANAEKYYRV
jgi:predicted TIM-barrel fold metal-dependent hydrolase